MIVLDTNVLSEMMRSFPSAQIVRWVREQPLALLFTTSVTQAEILYGLELLPVGRRRHALEMAIVSMFENDFSGRILPFDTAAARIFPKVAAMRRTLGLPITQSDAQIAAIARAHGASVATRNSSDFEHCGVSIINPWKL